MLTAPIHRTLPSHRRSTAGLNGGTGALLLGLSLAACSPAQDELCGELPRLDGGNKEPSRRRSIALAADPNGLFWEPSSGSLYIADDDGNQILKWTDAAGIGAVTKLPAAPAEGPGLGQLVVTADGTLVVTRFGHGTAGDVVFATREGALGTVTGLATERRRIGLTVAPDGTLFDSFFIKSGATRNGTVATLTLSGRETDAITGLKKPVGVLALGSDLYVSDQDLGQILKAPLATPAAVSVFATLPAPDLLAAGPQGSLFTGGLQGVVRMISASGTVSVVQSGLKQPRGLAWDPSANRLFIANHDSDPSDGIAHTLEIVPLSEDIRSTEPKLPREPDEACP